MSATRICPECAGGKPSNCTGWALDDDDNELACAKQPPWSDPEHDVMADIRAAMPKRPTTYESEES